LARKILLADDSVTAQNMGRKILADAGYDVVTVNNGSAALKRVAEIRPDLIVLDVYMPGYSGLEVCQRLKDSEETAHIPVLLTVGKLEPFKAEEGRRVRADNHIVKPFEASELLSAITRLEDHIVPQQSGAAARFHGKGNNREESNPETDTGWKSRLSFSSKKKKEEPESAREEFATGASFRDFRKTKSKPGSSAPVTAQAVSPAAAEPSAIHDVPALRPVEVASNDASKIPGNIAHDVSDEVPRDITPEELDALSALASKLNPSTAETDFSTELQPTAEGELPSMATEAATESATEAKPAGDATQVGEHAEVSVDASDGAVEARSEVEIPVQCVELAVESAEPVHSETHPDEEAHAELAPAESQPSETPVLMEVSTALLAEEAAPVDRNDEPTFASSAKAIEQASATDTTVTNITVTNTEDQPVEALAGSEQAANSDKVETSAPEEVITLAAGEPHPEELKPCESAISLPETAIRGEVEGMAPSDAELVEALRLLTPCVSVSDLFTVPSPGMMAAAGQLLAEQARQDAASGPRWIAEPMTLSPEEAALSLEAEMARTFAARPAAEVSEQPDSNWVTGVSAIQAAVDNRLAEANLITGANASSSGETKHGAWETASEATLAEASSTPNAVETLKTETPAQAVAIVSVADGAMGSEPEHSTEETPKAMAAAAAADGSISSMATDASTIASIVDSVMADLRPRIVEEIARKLAKKD
jgi:CheY-like chemotaxis protein